MHQKQKRTTRKRTPLSLRERSIIEIRWDEGKTVTAIATELGRNKSSVSREIGGSPRKGRGAYHAERAHAAALLRIEKRGNISILERSAPLKEYVVEKLKLGWSPEQISLRLPIDHKRDTTMRISHETIYQHVYDQMHRGGNGAVKQDCEDLRPYLARRHTRRQKKGFRKAQKMERTTALPSIEDRPAVVDRRTRVGDWEDDTLVSRAGDARVKSVNERKTGVVFFGRTEDGTATACDAVVLQRLAAIPAQYRKTLTRDRGTENRGYRDLEKELHLSCYFAHAYCSQERGSNENLNGLLRRYFPKGTNWDTISDKDIARAEYLINSRPRKRFKGRTPYEVFYQKTGVALFP